MQELAGYVVAKFANAKALICLEFVLFSFERYNVPRYSVPRRSAIRNVRYIRIWSSEA